MNIYVHMYTCKFTLNYVQQYSTKKDQKEINQNMEYLKKKKTFKDFP